jgi:hypothetical protein
MWLPGAGVGGEDLTAESAKRREFTTEARDVRKNPSMLREPQHERDGVIGSSST